MKIIIYHGTSVDAALAMIRDGIDLEHHNRRDPGDFGWGFYGCANIDRCKAHGRALLRVEAEGNFAHISNPYFLRGLDRVEPQTEVEKLFHSLVFEGRVMLTVKGRERRRDVCREVARQFMAAGYDGITTDYDGQEAVLFNLDAITSLKEAVLS
jgi:hypothetical protein